MGTQAAWQSAPSPEAFDDAVFISYAHIDNQPAGPIKARWIDEFRDHLAVRLSELFGDQVSIFQDEELRGNDALRSTLRSRLEKVATLVSVCSPRYVKSDFCQWELQEFVSMANARNDEVLNKSRVFKALKTPVPNDTLPSPLDDLVGYEFFEEGLADGRVREYLRNPQEQERWKFYARVDDIAEDVAGLLNELGYRGRRLPSGPDDGHTIFLAETALDMSDQRDTLRRELERRGHRVLPESPLPLDIDELAAMLTDQLNEADFAIHLFGERYGPRPDGSDASMPQLQFEAAGLWAGGGNVHQLVWVPDIDLQPVPAQQQLLYGLEQLEVGRNTEIVRAPLNLFKAHMLDRLDAAQRPAPDDPVAKPASSTRRFYLLHHQDDAAGASLVRKELEAKGFLVDVPLFRGTEAEMREVHETSLVLCDAVVIYHGGVSEHWLRMKQFDLVKAFGWGRTKPFAVKAVWVASSAMLSESSLAADLVILDSNGAQDMASLVSALDTELRNAARHA